MGATSTYTCRQKEEAFRVGCKAACCASYNTVPIEAIEA